MGRRGGNDEMGFAIDTDVMTRTLTVRAWGFWSASIAVDFVNAVTEEQQRSGVRAIAFDMGDLKPMREEGQAAWTRLVARLSASVAIHKISIATRSQLTKLQLLRLARAAAGANVTKLHWIEDTMSGGGETR